MAAQQSVWGIDIGQSALKAIKLTYDAASERAVAQSFDFIEHDKILSQPDADPDELIRHALEKFLSRNDCKEDMVVVGMPGQSGLARFVKLPPVEVKKIPEIVMFEARQQIPFPLEDVVWDFQKIGGGEEETEGFALETEVGIFAIKQDMVFRQLAPFNAAHLEVDVVQLAPVSLYNYIAYDEILHGQLGGGGDAQVSDEEGDTIVILDVGADKTDVVITDGDMIWLRNLPIGGNHFTRALTKELKLTFAKAEHLKRNATKAPDPKKLYQAMRPVFQDFVSELQRSIGYFSSSHRTNVIQKVIGVGNGFKLPGLQKFLQQNLQYKVEKVSSFHGMTGDEVMGSSSFSENMASFCVAYGLALQGLHQTPIQTNLLPKEIQAARMIREKKPWTLTAASMLVLAFVAIYWGHFRVLKAVSAETFKGPTESAKAATGKFNSFKSDYNSKVSEINNRVDFGKQLIGADARSDPMAWMKIFKYINEALPPRAELKRGAELDDVAEVNVEFIDAAYYTDVSTWFNGLDENEVKKSMAAADLANPPTGEGWVCQVRGYTFHRQNQLFVLKDVLPRFQTEQMKERGITHAVLFDKAVDREWTPAKGSACAEWESMRTVVKSTIRSPIGGISSGMTSSGGMMDPEMMAEMMGGGDMMEAYEEMENFIPSDMAEYMEGSEMQQRMMLHGPGGVMGMRGGPVTPEMLQKKLVRTDFSIKFIWRQEGPQQPEAGQEAGDGVEQQQ